MAQSGGQLAAGKPRALDAIVNRHGGWVARVSPDNFRAYHPKFDAVMREHPQEMVALTRQAMHAWFKMVRDYAHTNGHGLVVGGTFRSVDKLLKHAEEMAQSVEGVHPGFTIEVDVVATAGGSQLPGHGGALPGRSPQGRGGGLMRQGTILPTNNSHCR